MPRTRSADRAGHPASCEAQEDWEFAWACGEAALVWATDLFVPYWYFDSRAGREIIQRDIVGAKLIAYHIPPGELKSMTEKLAKSDPEVTVPQRVFELTRVRDSR